VKQPHQNTEDWFVKTAKEIVSEWGYEEEGWWKPIAEALTQARQEAVEETIKEFIKVMPKHTLSSEYNKALENWEGAIDSLSQNKVSQKGGK
jgi:hypothetical protein